FAPVPGRVDVAQNIRSLTQSLVFMVIAERCPRRCPGQLAERAFLDQPADAFVVRAEHLPRRRDQLDALGRRLLNEVGGLRCRRGHRLVEMDVLSGADGLQALLVVEADGRAERYSLYVRVGQKFLITLVGARDAELLGGG